MGNSYSQTPLQRLVQASASSDVSTLESVKQEFFQQARKKGTNKSEIDREFAKLLDSVEPTTSHTALFAACLTGGLPALEWILKHGVNVNTLTSTGNTALHTVVINQHPGVRRHAPHLVAALLNAGIQADHKNNNGATAVMLARNITKKLFNSSQVLRTLEVNGSKWHGLLGVEEHGDVAKLAGSVLGLLNIGNPRSASQSAANNARNKISEWTGGVFRPRWGCVTGRRIGQVEELFVYESFEDTAPLFHMVASSCTLTTTTKVARPGSVKSGGSMAAAVEGFRGHGGYSLSGLGPQDVLIRASLTSPDITVLVQLDTPSFDAFNRALQDISRGDNPLPPPSAPSANGGGGGGQPVVAVPLSEDGGYELAEAVVIGPEEEAIEAQVVADTYGDSPAPSAPAALASAAASVSDESNVSDKTRGAQGELIRPTEADFASMSEEEMIAEAIKRSQPQSLPVVPTQSLPSLPSPTRPSPTSTPNTTTLPYKGDLQAAMRAQDRSAIRQIMTARQAQPTTETTETTPPLPTLPALPARPLPSLPTLPNVPSRSSNVSPVDSEIEELEARLASLRAQRST